jgi:hypothetical protein
LAVQHAPSGAFGCPSAGGFPFDLPAGELLAEGASYVLGQCTQSFSDFHADLQSSTRGVRVSEAFMATTLSWLGDPAAESYARQVLARIEAPQDGPARPRRAASARLDLALALVATDQMDEAARLTLAAVTSGLLVPSNYWRAAEVISAVESRGVPQAAELREAYRELCRPPEPKQLR